MYSTKRKKNREQKWPIRTVSDRTRRGKKVDRNKNNNKALKKKTTQKSPYLGVVFRRPTGVPGNLWLRALGLRPSLARLKSGRKKQWRWGEDEIIAKLNSQTKQYWKMRTGLIKINGKKRLIVWDKPWVVNDTDLSGCVIWGLMFFLDNLKDH